MHRIDTATARPDVNGTGKTGFSDNKDLSNQDATYLSPDWCNAVQEELATVVETLGDKDSNGNVLDKAKNNQLATALGFYFAKAKTLEQVNTDLNQRLDDLDARLKTREAIVFEAVKVGQLISFDKHFATPAEVATYMGYGMWERALQGRVGVGFSEIASDPEEFRTFAAEYGSFKHQLTVDEMPIHDHRKKDYDAQTDGDRTGETMHYGEAGAGMYQGVHATGKTGGDKPHPNQPPSRTVDWWKRVA